jgi:MFS family permease
VRRIAAAGIMMTVSNARKMQNTRHRSVGFRILAIIAGFIGGGFLNYYTVVLLSTQTDLSEYSWNVASERNVIVAVAVANLALGVLLFAIAAHQIRRKRFGIKAALSLGVSLAVFAYFVFGFWAFLHV